MGKTKKDMNASRAAGRRKQTTETATSFPDFPVFFFNFPMGLSESNDSSISNSSEESLSTSLLSLSSSQIFTRPFSSLDLICLPTWYDSYSFIREANFRFFTHWCTFIRSSLFSLFRTGPCFSLVHSQFVTSIQEIPAKIVSVDCIRAIGLSIKR